ncbi:MAG: DUF1269 domain-containing protein [Planktothrix sp.]|uniref:DUF1269 domain-containing protein n=1 Tax=Planktothrix sp. TaxID=3088171 RepID=UPI0038D37791
MSDLIAIAYDDEYKAEEVRLTLIKLQKEHLIELEDAAVIVKNAEGKVKLKQAVDLTTAGAVSGGFWGLLIGTLFLSPVLGAAVGAAAGAASGALSDIGVDDNFMKSLGETLKPGSSALFVLVRKVTPDKVLDEVAPYGGTVLRTSLSKDEEAQLQEVLTSRGVSV